MQVKLTENEAVRCCEGQTLADLSNSARVGSRDDSDDRRMAFGSSVGACAE